MQRDERWVDVVILGAWLAGWAALVLLTACAAAYVPSGIPGCPERQQWSDSAQACRPVEGER